MARFNTSDLLIEVAEAHNALGLEQTISVLKSARQNKSCVDAIVSVALIICEVVDIKIETLGSNNLREDKRKIAIGLCIFFIKRYYKFSYEEISKVIQLNLKYSIMLRYHNMIKKSKKDNPKTEIDKMINQYYAQIEKRLISEIKN